MCKWFISCFKRDNFLPSSQDDRSYKIKFRHWLNFSKKLLMSGAGEGQMEVSVHQLQELDPGRPRGDLQTSGLYWGGVAPLV